MFAKYAFDRARAAARAGRLPRPVTRSRNRLVAVWRREPLSGRLELKWQWQSTRNSHRKAVA